MRPIRRLLVVLLSLAATLAMASSASAVEIKLAGTPEPITWGQGHMDVFVKGSDGALWHRPFLQSTGGWANWESLGGDMRSNRASAVTWGPGHIDVFVRGPGDYLYHRWFSNGAWSGWHQLGNTQFQGDPKAVSWGNGHIAVFVRGLDNRQRHISYASACNGWCPAFDDHGGVLNSDPEPISLAAGHLAVFSRSTDNQLQYRWLGANGWGAWERRPGPALAGGPEAVTWGPQHLGIFARGTSNTMIHLAWANNLGGWRTWEDLGGQLTSDGISGVSFGEGHFAIYSSGPGDAPYDRWYQQNVGGWGPWWRVADERQMVPGTHARAASWGNGHLDVYWRHPEGSLRHRAYVSGWAADPQESLGMPRNERYGTAFSGDPDGYFTQTGGQRPFNDPLFTKLGMRQFRTHIAWNSVTTNDTRDLGRVDRLVTEAKAAGQEVVLTIRRRDGTATAQTPPTPDAYRTAVDAIVRRYADRVDIWGPANEVNAGEAWLGGSPNTQPNPSSTLTGPQLAARYFQTMTQLRDSLDPSARVISPEFHDVFVNDGDADRMNDPTAAIAPWVDAYESAASAIGVTNPWGSGAGFHPHGTVQRMRADSLNDFIAALPATTKVWLTETSAFARRTNDSGVLTWGSNDPVQAGLYQERRVKWLLDELMTGTQRIERLYYYFVRSPGEDLRTADAWDSGLAQPNGTKRPSWGLFCRRAGGFISGNCVY